MQNNTHKNAPFGSISTGTLNNIDLLPACLFALEDLDQVSATRFNSELIELGFSHSQCGVAFGEADEWPIDPDSDEILEIIDDICDTLNNFAGEYCYFGAHTGNGSDIGFWINWEAIEDAEHDGDLLRVSDLSDSDGFEGEYILLVNDHGNASLYCGETELWSVV